MCALLSFGVGTTASVVTFLAKSGSGMYDYHPGTTYSMGGQCYRQTASNLYFGQVANGRARYTHTRETRRKDMPKIRRSSRFTILQIFFYSKCLYNLPFLGREIRLDWFADGFIRLVHEWLVHFLLFLYNSYKL